MPALNGETIVVIEPGVVEVFEEPDDHYVMHEADALASIVTVKSNRWLFATDQAWEKRIRYYESILAVILSSKDVLS